jgi:predicted NUDIX family NTP pyrophosphohydrolase
MAKAEHSAGLLMYRRRGPEPEVLLVHPGGPYWSKKDDGAWSIPKGLCDAAENPLVAARREFEEETGCRPDGDFVGLGDFKQPSGKLISVWAFEGDFNLELFRSNLFSLEWPPRSGRRQDFPEADRAGWFAPALAARKLLRGQLPILDALLASLQAA